MASASIPHGACSTTRIICPRKIAKSMANRAGKPWAWSKPTCSSSRTRQKQTMRWTQYGLFPREKQLGQNGEFMPKATRKSKTGIRRQATPVRTKRPAFTSRQKRELARLAAMPDEKIDTSDIPELPPNAWKDAVRGRFYRPIKQAVSMRLDADVVAWLKKRGKGYQTRANSILRQRMLDETKRA